MESKIGSNRGSTFLTVLFSCGLTGCLLFDIRFLIEWRQMIDAAVFSLVLTCIMEILWLILILESFVQRNNIKYKNPGEDDPTRKNRRSVTSGIGIAVILGFFTIAAKTVSAQCAGVIYESRWGKDIEYLNEIAQMAADTYQETQQKGIPWETRVKAYEDKLGCTVGDPVIEVKLTDSVVYVEVKNAIQKPGSKGNRRLNTTLELRNTPQLLFIYTEECLPESYKFPVRNVVCAVDTFGQFFSLKGSDPATESVEWVAKLKETDDPEAALRYPFYGAFEYKLSTDEGDIWDRYQIYTKLVDDENSAFCDEEAESALSVNESRTKIYGVRYDEDLNLRCDLFYYKMGEAETYCGGADTKLLAEWFMTTVGEYRDDSGRLND